MGNLDKLSVFVSLVLRHKPDAAHITLDEHGWANVEELLNGINDTGRKIDMKILEEIVVTDNKQRYSFNQDKTLIRANQGHSIPVDVELKEQEPPEFLYHGTATRFLGNIMNEGLKPMSRLYVHLSKDTETALKVGKRHGEPVVLKIYSREMHKDGYKFYLSQNGVWLTKKVDTKYFDVKDNTINYYNSNAKEFASGTVSLDFEHIQKKFTDRLPKKSAILDFGCGAGRDTKYFISQGYQVDAVDGSVELCRLASEYTGIEVKNIFFNELAEVEKYDGIWACSSILHLPLNELAEVMCKMVTALKDNGIIYTSFKYGTFSGERNGRYFTDMTEDTFADFIKQIKKVRLEEMWISTDIRPKRGEEKWLNLILRKK